MPENAMYCHACHRQWQRESDSFECPACGSASTEIITLGNDPREFHNQSAETMPAAGTSAPAEPHSTNVQPTAVADPSDNDQDMTDAPANEPANAPANNTTNSTTDAAGNSGAQTTHGNRPEFVFVIPPPMVFVTTVVTDTHVPPPNAAGPIGPPVTTHFTMNFYPPIFRHHTPQTPAAPPSTGVNSPPTGTETPAQQQQDAAGNLHSTTRPMPAGGPLSWLELLLGTFVPPNIALGDAVFSNEALDRIISQLREQSGPGGAPPASQAAIDKLEVKELDEKMLGGETKSRCVICVDEMSVGDKASVLPCSHFFHGECVTPWLKQHNTCPVCRRSIEPEPNKPAKAAEFAHDAHQEQQHEHASDAQGCS